MTWGICDFVLFEGGTRMEERKKMLTYPSSNIHRVWLDGEMAELIGAHLRAAFETSSGSTL